MNKTIFADFIIYVFIMIAIVLIFNLGKVTVADDCNKYSMVEIGYKKYLCVDIDKIHRESIKSQESSI